MNRSIQSIVASGILAALIAVAAVPSPAVAEHSNRNQVRANLSDDGWRVVWGKNFTEREWLEGSAAIAESIAAENPGPFLRWFDENLQENYSKIQAKLPGLLRRDLERWVLQSIKSKKIVHYRGVRIQAGFATYDRWDLLIYDEPRTERYKIYGPTNPFTGERTWTWGFRTKMERVERKVNLPNWHQFYVRYQFAGDGGGGNGGGNGGGVQIPRPTIPDIF